MRSLLVVALAMLPLAALAQPTTGARAGDNEPVLKKGESQGRSSAIGEELPPVERAVDPALYYLGPNDQLMLSLPILEGGEFPLVVSLDNTLLLPRGFPLVNVSGMTLARLRAVVDSLYRSRSSLYKNVSLSLLKPRSIYVTISGDVLIPGRYVMTAADRVTTAIDLANKVSESLTAQQQLQLIEAQAAERERQTSSPGLGVRQVMPRWVTVRHNDGRSRKIDLLRYRALGDDTGNPTLREGDEVIVHGVEPGMPTLAIAGAVNSPMVIPYSRGDNALLLARLSAGLRIDADRNDVFISRRGDQGMTRLAVDIDDSAALAAIELQPGDQLVVTASETSTAVTGAGDIGVVSVRGEVGRPSIYPIISGVTMLSEVIAQAGGVTQNAALNGAYIERLVDTRYGQTVRDPIRHPGSYMSASSLSMDDTTRLRYDLENQQNRVSADFVELIERGNRGKDVPLQSGDAIVIPPNPKHVFVRGRVAHPGWVTYVPGGTYEYYIEKAGGFIDAAVPGRSQVRKYGTGVWDAPDETTILPGDEIYVPGERDLPGRTSLETAGTIIAITSGILAIAHTIFNFVRDLNKE